MSWTDGPRNLFAAGAKVVGAQGVAEDVSRGRTHDLLVASNPETKYDKYEAMANLAGQGDKYREMKDLKGKATDVSSELEGFKKGQGVPDGGVIDTLTDRFNGPLGEVVNTFEEDGLEGLKGSAQDLLSSGLGQAKPDLAGMLSEVTEGLPLMDKIGDLLPASGAEKGGSGLEL